MARKGTHGGKRPGSGRRPVNPEGKTASLTVSVPRSLIEQLDSYAAERGWNRSQAVTAAIRRIIEHEP